MSERSNFYYYFLLIVILSIFLVNIKNSILHGYFFISLNLLIISIFLILFNIIKNSNFIYVWISITSISFSLLLFDFIALGLSPYFNLEEKNSNFKIIESGNFSSVDTRVYSKNIPSGYLIRDGNFKSKKSYIANSDENILFDVEYDIVEGLRVHKNKIKNNICSDVILFGGSHNFGWGLNFEETLQGLIEKNNLTTINFSTPGFGLNNSLALFQERSKHINCNSQNKDTTLLIYRAIDDHINRNVNKTSLNVHGPNFFHKNLDKEDQFESNCNKNLNCVFYLTKYFITRLSYYLITTEYEKSSNIIGSLIDNFWRYKESDFEKTNVLINFMIEFTNNKYHRTEFLMIIDDGDTFNAKRMFEYVKKIENLQIILFGSKNIFFLKENAMEAFNTSNLISKICGKEKTLHIPFDYHPTKCHNLILYEILNKQEIL